MPKVGSFIHTSKKSGLSVGYDSSFGTSKVVALDLNAVDALASFNAPANKKAGYFIGRLQLIRLRGTVSGAANITIKATWDANGTQQIISPTAIVFSNDQLDVDGSGKHTITLLVDAAAANRTSELYIFGKTDAGTFTITECEATWVE